MTFQFAGWHSIHQARASVVDLKSEVLLQVLAVLLTHRVALHGSFPFSEP